MSALRWLLSIPAAILASLATFVASSSVWGSAYYGGGILRSAVGLCPIFLTTTFPAIAFVLAGVSVSPSRGRTIAFVYFPVAVLFSLGSIEILRHQDFSHVFWLTASLGQLFGGFVGLVAALKLQQHRKRNEKPA